MNTLKFVFGNAKLSKNIASMALPAGHSCPFAKECYSKANQFTGKVIDGKHCQFRCFAATEERMPAVRMNRWNNFNLIRSIKSEEKLTTLINDSVPETKIVRIHPSGDFFSEKYFVAWLNVAYNNPSIIFYAYTKALPHWIKYKDNLPSNLKLIASKGGTHDYLIAEQGLRYAHVVFSEQEAKDLNLPIDKDDSLVYEGNGSIALLLHGVQPKGTVAAKAWYKIMKAGKGYSMKNKINNIINKNKPVKMHIKWKPGKGFSVKCKQS